MNIAAKNLALTVVLSAAVTSVANAQLPAARLSDPTNFGGTIVNGAATVLINGLPAARVNDMIVTPRFVFPINCVGGPIIGGATTVLIAGMPAARVGDIAVTACGPEVIVTGSPNVLIGN
jgi:uncharacterized Zn-binding protein involved in type VI secretion